MDQEKSKTGSAKKSTSEKDEFGDLENFIKKKEAQSKVLKKILESYENEKTTKSNQ